MLVDVFESSEEAGEREKERPGEGNTEQLLSEDPGLWPDKLTAQQRETLVCRLASERVDLTKVAPKDKEGKAFPDYLQYVKSANMREKIRRDWLIHSDSAKALFCIPCLLFSHEQTRPSKSALNSKDGLKLSDIKWQKMYRKFPEHEKHTPHKQCYVKWKSLQHSLLVATGVDGHLQKQLQTEAEKHTKILERLLDVTLHLASRNLAFRGKTSNLDDVHNGNFLGTLELLAHYDPFIHEHLEKVKQKKKGSRLTHYLSPDTQNEFIELCGKRVLSTILKEREDAIYYSVICDSTPDISHTEQNVILVRYVHQDKEDRGVWKIVERFIEFKDFHKKTGQEISEMIIEALQSNGIPLQECRGQGYDNGANMSGKVKGVQAQILKANPLATFSPCATHTLNLVGVHAAESCPEVATFFGSVNRLYNLFSASPERWAILKEKTGCSLHRLSDTRWSARIAAVRVVAAHLPSILEALECVLATCSLTSEAKSEANGLINYFKTFDAIVLLTVWVKILQCIDNRNVILQAGDISLDVEAANIKALQEEMQALRNRWDSLLAEATLVAHAMDVPDHFRSEERRKRKRKCMPDEMRQEDATTEDSVKNAFRNNIFFVAMDSIISALSARFQTTANICETFAPILKLSDMTEAQIKTTCRALAKIYHMDLSQEFENEVLHFCTIYDATFPKNLSSLELLNAIWEMQLQSIFGEICIALRIFCTLPITVAGGERAFSKLKLVKNYLRSTMGQDRLNSLAILSIESQLAKQLDFTDLISDFANKKTRQWAFTGM
uniref:TTF-type domain-containing protein n=1 Tax=Astyanax mexicanus TaxID=7994 RepID=A0A3B1IJ48_ASTMX